MIYQSFKEHRFCEEIGEYVTYGIKTEDEAYTISDISSNDEVIDNITGCMNKNDVSVLHMNDVIEDMIISYSL
ncbi:MAG: hypothetical protein J1F64_03575 [Oscillospiraceae bacterium]|nr:hypothetical protein [Oscillospiraceae bacterium]